MTVEHHIFARADVLSVRCRICNDWPANPHVYGITPYCAGCCPNCRPPAERVGEVRDLVGEQAGLFA